MNEEEKRAKKKRERVLKRYAQDYENLRVALWDTCRDNAATALGLAPEEIEEEFACLT